MALLATPRNVAFCIDKKDSGVLSQKSPAVLDALHKIRAAEAKRSSASRLQSLDSKISSLQDTIR